MSKRDDVSRLYRLPQKIDTAIRWAFVANILAAIISLISAGVVQTYMYLAQVLATIVYIVLEAVNNYFLWQDAEAARSKSNIKDAFDIDLTRHVTDGYFNNRFKPSLNKYIVNSFESVYFSKCLSAGLRWKQSARALLALLVCIALFIWVENEAFYPVIAQAVFSSSCLLSAIAFLAYHAKLNRLFEDFYRELISVGVTKKEQLICLLSFCIEYETIKARYNVHWKESYFLELNEQLSKEWNEIESKISFSIQN